MRGHEQARHEAGLSLWSGAGNLSFQQAFDEFPRLVGPPGADADGGDDRIGYDQRPVFQERAAADIDAVQGGDGIILFLPKAFRGFRYGVRQVSECRIVQLFEEFLRYQRRKMQFIQDVDIRLVLDQVDDQFLREGEVLG